MYIYSNIVQPRLISDTSVHLLRSVTTQGNRYQMVKEEFKNVRVPLEYLQTDQIHIHIADSLGNEVDFERGRVVVTLHVVRQDDL